jgi:hypothetical protein
MKFQEVPSVKRTFEHFGEVCFLGGYFHFGNTTYLVCNSCLSFSVGMIDANMLGTCYECKGECLRCVGMVGKDVEDDVR